MQNSQADTGADGPLECACQRGVCGRHAIDLSDDIVRFETCLRCRTAREHHPDPRIFRIKVNDKSCPVENSRLVVAGAPLQIQLPMRAVEDERKAIEDSQSDISS